ncbi:MAG: glycosyltransferase, partial [Thermoleophilaceae bacterium]|nr:glycosyltransferase [Thermoleophilaceae bacterium]
MIVFVILFWVSALLLVYTQVLYPAIVAVLARTRRVAPRDGVQRRLPAVSIIIAAYAEEAVIGEKVANALALNYPPELLQVIVCCDDSPDATAEVARAAGAHKVIELPRGGKHRAQDAGVLQATGEIFAFSDANTHWQPDALLRLIERFRDAHVGYVCGSVSFENEGGTNQEGLYWRYEMWLRANESRLRSITAGNGAIYAVRRQAYLTADQLQGGHDLS